MKDRRRNTRAKLEHQHHELKTPEPQKPNMFFATVIACLIFWGLINLLERIL